MQKIAIIVSLNILAKFKRKAKIQGSASAYNMFISSVFRQLCFRGWTELGHSTI
jgi:hypothetical protein